MKDQQKLLRSFIVTTVAIAGTLLYKLTQFTSQRIKNSGESK